MSDRDMTVAEAREWYADLLETTIEETAEQLEGEPNPDVYDAAFTDADAIVSNEYNATFMGIIAESDNSPRDDMLTTPDGWDDTLQTAAFSVVEQDVIDGLRDRGFDV